ncbi:capsular biosynthesis protein, partial [Priestia megaterium]
MKRIYNDLNKFSSNPELLEKERNKFELNLDHSRIIKHAEERKKNEAQAN